MCIKLTERERYLVEFTEKHGDYNCFPFFRKENASVVIFFDLQQPHGKVICLQRGGRLSKEEEKVFFSLLDSFELKIDGFVWNMLESAILNEWKTKLYAAELPCKMKLMKLYYACFSESVFEILYKCPGIEGIARACLEKKIEVINYLGKSPQEILGVQLPMLRAMEKNGIDYLRKPEDRAKFMAIYKRHHGLINGILTVEQIEYLLKAQVISPQVFRSIGEPLTESEAKTLEYYQRIREDVLSYYKTLPLYVRREEIQNYFELAKDIQYMIINREILNKHLERVQIYKEVLRENVKLLGTVEDFLETAACFRNCLYNYPIKIAFSQNIVLVIENRVCVELDMENKYLIEARGKKNRLLSDKEQAMVRDYLEEIGIIEY